MLIDEAITSRDYLQRAYRRAKLPAKQVDAVHHITVLPTRVHLCGRSRPVGEFFFCTLAQRGVVQIRLGQDVRTVATVFLSSATADDEEVRFCGHSNPTPSPSFFRS